LDVGDDSGNEDTGNPYGYGYGYGYGAASRGSSRRGSSSTNTTVTPFVGGAESVVGSPTKRLNVVNEYLNGNGATGGNVNLKGRAESKPRSKSGTKSRSGSAGMGLTADDFKFGDVLGEGSYSTVRIHLIVAAIIV
jgi:hypothetical protein